MSALRVPINHQSILPWEKGLVVDKLTQALPKLSIVIPIYNSANLLEKTLRSLLCNDLTNVELILIDAGSQDNTMEIVKYYDDIFTYFQSKPDDGQSDAINKGYKIAKGDILYWLNGDDILLPNTLNKIRYYFHHHKECEVLVGNAFMTEIDFTPRNKFVFSREKLKFPYLLDYAKNHLVQPSVFFTRKAWKAVGPLDVYDHYAMDADLFIGMSKRFDMHYIDVDIAYSVYHKDCKTRGARAESITALALVQAKYGGFAEAKATLNILVNLYHQQEKQLNNIPNNAKLKVLSTKLATLESHTEKQKELCLQVDLKEHP